MTTQRAYTSHGAQSPQSSLTLSDPIDCSPPGSSVHGILQTGILERLDMPFSRGSSQPKDQTGSPSLQADSLPTDPPRKSHISHIITLMSIHCIVRDLISL